MRAPCCRPFNISESPAITGINAKKTSDKSDSASYQKRLATPRSRVALSCYFSHAIEYDVWKNFHLFGRCAVVRQHESIVRAEPSLAHVAGTN